MIEIFDLLEFQIMAAARQMKSYYGFPTDHEPKPEELRYTVYQMMRRGLLKQQGQDLVIQEPAAGYINGIVNAKNVLVVDRGGYILPRQCIYYNADKDNYICMENSNTAWNQVCLSELNEQELFCQMEDLNQLPDEKQEENFEQEDLILYWNIHMPEVLLDLMKQGLNVKTEQLLNQKEVYTVFSDRNKITGVLKHRMIILDLFGEYGMVVQEAGLEECVEIYSRKRALEFLKNWWRQ